MKPTQMQVNKLTCPTGQSDLIHWDDEVHGLGFRIRASGNRTWVFQYKINGNTKRLTLGDYPAVPAAEARQSAAQLKSRVRDGRDPQLEKQQRLALAAETFAASIEPYLAHKQPAMRRTSHDRLRHDLALAKSLHPRSLVSIDRRAVATLIEQIAAKNGPVAAGSVWNTLSNFFSWAIAKGMLDTNPVAGTPKPPPRPPRDRVLRDDEIKAVWTHLGSSEHDDVVRLLLLTGQRRSEIGGLCWSELNLDRAVLTLQGSRVKNWREHHVPLSEPVLDILKRQQHRVKRDGTERDCLFGRDDVAHNVHDQQGFRGWGAPLDKLRARIAADGIAMDHWTLHDIRRSVATGLGNLGVEPHVISGILNHSLDIPRVTRTTYLHTKYEPQKRQALNLWAEHVMSLVGGRDAKIVPLSARQERGRLGGDNPGNPLGSPIINSSSRCAP